MATNKTPGWAVIGARFLLVSIFVMSSAFMFKGPDVTYVQALLLSLVFLSSIVVPLIVIVLVTIVAMGGPLPWELIKYINDDIEDRPG